MYDVIIIGAGVSGCAIARELSRFELKIAVLEKAFDVCEGTSKANSGIVHAGYDAKPGSLKARLNVEGSRKMEALSKELDFPYKKNGSIVLCFDEQDKDKLYELKQRGELNGHLARRREQSATGAVVSHYIVGKRHLWSPRKVLYAESPAIRTYRIRQHMPQPDNKLLCAGQ